MKSAGSKWEGGDIGFVDPSGEPLIRFFNIEAKTGYARKAKLKSGKTRESNWCALDVVDSSLKKPVLCGIWNQCCNDAMATNREPLLIFRRYRRLPCIAFSKSLFNKLIDFYGRPSHSTPYVQMYWLEPEYDHIVVLNLMDFFKWIPNLRPYIAPRPILRTRRE